MFLLTFSICKTLAVAFIKLIHVIDGICVCVLLIVWFYFEVSISSNGSVLWASPATTGD